MNLSSFEVWQRITASQLAEAKQCRTWATRAAKSLPNSDASDGVKLLQCLIQLGYLTKYQARILAGQLESPLRIGSWRVLEPVAGPLWKGWLQVSSDADAAGASQEPRWSKRLSAADLQQLQDAKPSIDFARCQASIHGSHLQPVYEPQVIDGHLLLHVAPVTGKSLMELFPAQLPDPGMAQAIIRQVGSALACMHQSELSHGCVRPDRVYWNGQQATLVRDPICRFPVTVEGRECSSIGQLLDAAGAIQFLAPEFMVPGQLPTRRSDVYALGCLWRWLLTRQSTANGSAIITDTPRPAVADVTEQAAAISDRIAQSQPLQRVLQCALAKKPAHRFASATEFCQAFSVAVALNPGEQPSSKSQAPPSKAPTATVTDSPELSHVINTPAQSHKPKPRIQTAAKSVQTSPLKTRRRNRKSGKWMLPLMGGCGLLIVLMLALHFSGALRRTGPDEVAERKPPPVLPKQPVSEQRVTEMAEPDPLSDYFVLVDASETGLWAPPSVPAPISLELLPPGGQCFIALRPASLLKSGMLANLRSEKGASVEDVIQLVGRRTGVTFEQMSRCTFAFYSAEPEGAFPQIAVRIELEEGESLANLLTAWGGPREQESPHQGLFAGDDFAYFVAQTPQPESQVTSFCVGPLELMREVAEANGAEGPLVTQVERLRKVSDCQADFVILLAPPYLYSEGRGLLQWMPNRLRALLPELIDIDVRAALLQTRFSPEWYIEAQLIGQNDRDAGRAVAKLQSQLGELPRKVEDWFVAEIPHPYWRSLALRYPQMLRALAEYTRFGVENGVAVMNAYLPTQASENLLLTSWIAMQDNATSTGETEGMSREVALRPLTIEEYLARPIKVSFAQEPIENALRLVGEEANYDLPPGSRPLRFELDGDAFENAGITRNQQLKDFNQVNIAVREALTEITRRGNPVTTVTDTRDEDQQLIWVITEDPQSPGLPMISLTTRAAAGTSGIELPFEFSP